MRTTAGASGMAAKNAASLAGSNTAVESKPSKEAEYAFRG